MWTSTDTSLPEDLQGFTWDFKGYANDGRDSEISCDLQDLWKNPTNRPSPITLVEEPSEAIMQLPSPAFEDTVSDYCRQKSPVESIISNAHDSHHQLDFGNEAIYMTHNGTEKDLGAITRKRKWPSRASNTEHSSPVLARNRDAAGLGYGSDKPQQRPCSRMNEDSAPQILTPCCGQHGNHGTHMRDSTKPKTPDTNKNTSRASSYSNKGVDLPSFLPRLSGNRQHNHRMSQSTDDSREKKSGKIVCITTVSYSNHVFKCKVITIQYRQKAANHQEKVSQHQQKWDFVQTALANVLD